MNYVARFDVAGDRRKLQDTLSVSILYYAFLGAILGIALYFLGGFITDRLLDDGGVLRRTTILTSITYISINIFFQFLTIPFTAILQGMRRFAATKGLSSIMNILRYLLVIIAAVTTGRIDIAFMIILGLTLVRLLALIAIFVFKTTQFRGMRVHFDLSLLRTLLNYTSILFISRIIGLIHNQIDKVLIWFYMALNSMTIYDVIARPSALLRLVMSVLNSAVIPEVARLHELKDIAAIRDLYIRLVRFAYLILMPILAVLYVFIGDLLRLWVGASFEPYAYLAMILLSVYLVLPIPSIASTVVVGLEKVKPTIWIPIWATSINIILSITLLQVIGLAGLLVGTLVAELFMTFPYLRAMMKFLDFRMVDVLRPLNGVVATAGIAAALYIGVKRLLPETGFAVPIAAAAIFCLNCLVNYKYLLSERERSFIRGRMSAAKARMAL